MGNSVIQTNFRGEGTVGRNKGGTKTIQVLMDSVQRMVSEMFSEMFFDTFKLYAAVRFLKESVAAFTSLILCQTRFSGFLPQSKTLHVRSIEHCECE